LGQATILDLACHCGVFSFDLADRGAKYVTGIEVRERNLRQAEFLKQYYRFENVVFQQADALALPDNLTADVVLCLGLLYHVVRPVDLVEYCFRSARRIAVIDSNCLRDPISAYQVVTGRDAASPIEGTRSIELLPTYRAIVDTMRAVGFSDVIEVIGSCDTPIPEYSAFTRRCLIGFKEGPSQAIRARLSPVIPRRPLSTSAT
jgi:SAM-dependent methyltransferase